MLEWGRVGGLEGGGKEIYYRENLKMMTVAAINQDRGIQLGTPRELFEVAVRNLSGRWYDVSPDGTVSAA